MSQEHQLLAGCYLAMHGTAGVRRKVTQLEGRKRLTARERSLLAALGVLLLP